jgi:hypothetical protein
MREFIDISPIYPPYINTKNFIIYKKIFTQAEYDDIPNDITRRDDVYPIVTLNKKSFEHDIGKEIVVLHQKNFGGMMSNHKTEMESCQEFLDKCYGDVLIFGLGLGIVVLPLLKDDSIKSITVIEPDQDLIDTVGFFIHRSCNCSCKLRIFKGDAFTYHRNLKEKYDTIWFDIWGLLQSSTIDEIEYFHKVYKKNLKEEKSLMLSWYYNELKEYFGSKNK